MVAENSCKPLYIAVCELLKPVSECYLFEAGELCRHFLKCSKGDFITGRVEVSETAAMGIVAAAKKRAEGYPLQYILGEWDFYGRSFLVGEGVLIPRADTEILIEAVLFEACTMGEAVVIADLCSGSGCIAITLAKEIATSRVYAVEKSELAFEYLESNANRHSAKTNLTAILGDVLCLETSLPMLDIVVSNPPYLTKAEMEALQKEVSYEPSMALYGEVDGLFFYREITRLWKNRLKSGGILAYEVGDNQADAVSEILKENGFKTICQRADLCDIIRVVYGRM